jgi:hypothetical protein
MATIAGSVLRVRVLAMAVCRRRPSDSDSHKHPLGVRSEQVRFHSFVKITGLCFMMLQ